MPELTLFSYQPLFETYHYDKLKSIAKQVYVSPINNWKLFSILKKRLEIAFELKNDLKQIIREMDLKEKGAVLHKIPMSKI